MFRHAKGVKGKKDTVHHEPFFPTILFEKTLSIRLDIPKAF